MPHSSDHISLADLKSDLSDSSFGSLFRDLKAGLSVAFLTVPQAMACAVIAGLPLYCGLYAAIFPAIVAALLGSSKHLIVGPSTSTAILVQAGTAHILFTHFREFSGVERELIAFQIMTQLTLLIAVIQILASVFKLGKLVNFVSHSVIIGYMAGMAASLAVNQIYILFGVPSLYGVYSVFEKFVYFCTHIYQTHLPTACLGLGSLCLMVLLKRMDKRIPAAVVAFALAGLVTHALASLGSDNVPTAEVLGQEWQKVFLVSDVGDIYESPPLFQIPFLRFGMMNTLLPVAFAVALLSILETTSVAKTLAAGSGQPLSVNQEIFGLGFGNLASTFVGALPISGSPSRSAMSYASGARTRFAAIFHGLSVALILFFFGFLVNKIPLTSLAALLLIASANIVHKRQFLLCLKATPSDTFVLWTTFFSCIFFSLDVAFYIGIVLSITLYLKKASVPHLIEYNVDESGGLKSIDHSSGVQEKRTIRVIKVSGELFFGAVDLFQTTLKSMAADDRSAQVIVLQMKNARDIDATACLALQQLYLYMRSSGRHLIICGLTMPIWEVLSDAGVVQELGKENLFMIDERHPYDYMRKTLVYARSLIQEEIVEEEEPPAAEEPLVIATEAEPVLD